MCNQKKKKDQQVLGLAEGASPHIMTNHDLNLSCKVVETWGAIDKWSCLIELHSGSILDPTPPPPSIPLLQDPKKKHLSWERY